MNSSFMSDGLRIASHLTLPPSYRPPGRLPGVIVCHGFPVGPIDARQSAGTFPQLVERIANEIGFAAMTFTFRGCGDSEGSFSLAGWASDLRAAIDELGRRVDLDGLWLVAVSTGGTLAVCVAADDPRVRGVALLSARADFDDLAAHPRRFLEHAREVGAIRDPRFPSHFDRWARELRQFRPMEAVRKLGERPMLILHGDDDDTVPVVDARLFAEAHGSAELRILPGAGHRLRHDARALAVLLGWLDRTRNNVAPA
jgi:putative redox protein